MVVQAGSLPPRARRYNDAARSADFRSRCGRKLV